MMNFESLKEQVTNLSLYDLKAGVRRVQNAVMNYTEMEAKVREATNNEPWGASSTLMQEIANGTHNYQHLNEIMPMIYKRFTEKSAEEWRQIYKSLQLLEFLIKNGSERVIDDARSHLTLLKMLRQFHFIDANGKDQGVNVRNRAKELAELLSDVDRIRAERKKTRATRNKYSGLEGGTGIGGSSGISSSSRFGGFGSEDHGGGTFGGYSGGVYGDGGGFGGQSGEFQDSGNRGDKFEEYDEYEEGGASPQGRTHAESSSSSSKAKRTERVAKKPDTPKKQPDVDLFSFDDPVPIASAISAPLTAADDDEFDDFQSATPSAQANVPASILSSAPIMSSTTTSYTNFASPQPVSAPNAANLSGMVGLSSISPPPINNAPPVNYAALASPVSAQPARPTTYQSAQPNYFTSVQAPAATPMTNSSMTTSGKPAPAKSASGGDAFGSIWNSASAGIKKTSAPTAGPALGQLAKEKSSAGIWGTTTTTTSQAPQPKPYSGSSGLDDLLG